MFHFENTVLVQIGCILLKKLGIFMTEEETFLNLKHLMSSSIETSLITYCTNVNWQDSFFQKNKNTLMGQKHNPHRLLETTNILFC